MIDFNTCKKCPEGEYHPPEEQDGEFVILPSVRCEVAGEELLMNREIPEGCPSILEHILQTENMTKKFADRMSGVRRNRRSHARKT